jgi:hypothetical protein
MPIYIFFEEILGVYKVAYKLKELKYFIDLNIIRQYQVLIALPYNYFFLKFEYNYI